MAIPQAFEEVVIHLCSASGSRYRITRPPGEHEAARRPSPAHDAEVDRRRNVGAAVTPQLWNGTRRRMTHRHKVLSVPERIHVETGRRDEDWPIPSMPTWSSRRTRKTA